MSSSRELESALLKKYGISTVGTTGSALSRQNSADNKYSTRGNDSYAVEAQLLEKYSPDKTEARRKLLSDWATRYDNAVQGISNPRSYYGQWHTRSAIDSFGDDIDALILEYEGIKDYADRLGIPNSMRYYNQLLELQKTIHQQNDWYKKYQGTSYDDVDSILSSMDDGDEKSWLSDNRHAVYRTNPDFTDKSRIGLEAYESNKPKNTEEESWFEAIGRYLGKVTDTTMPLGDTGRMAQEYREDETYKQIDDRWNDDQRAEFGYLYALDPQRAEQYAIDLNNALDASEKDDQREEIVANATSSLKSGALETGKAVLGSMTGFSDYLNDLIEYQGRGVITERGGYLTPAEYSSTVTSGVSEHLNDKYGTIRESVPVFGGKGVGDLYSLGTSVAQSMLSGHMLGKSGTLLSFFGSAAASTADDARSRGATDEQALALGTLSGIAEGAAEMIGVDNLLKRGAADIFRGFLRNTFRQGISEGVEEGLTSLFNNIAEDIVMGENSKFYDLVDAYVQGGLTPEEAKKKAWVECVEEMLFDAAGGFASGNVSGGIETVIQTGSRNRAAKRDLTDSAQELVTEGLQAPEGSKYYQMASDAQKRLDAGKSLSGGQLYRLQSANEQQMLNSDAQTIQKAVAARLTELGETGDIAGISAAIAKQVSTEAAGSALPYQAHYLSEITDRKNRDIRAEISHERFLETSQQKLSNAERRLISESKFGRRVLNELNTQNIRSGNYSADWTGNIGTESLNAAEYGRNLKAAEATSEEKIAVPQSQNRPVTSEPKAVKTPEANTPTSKFEQVQAKAKASGKEATIEDYASAYGKQSKAVMAVYELGEGKQDPAKFAEEYEMVYNWGASGISESFAMNPANQVKNSVLTDAQRLKAYQIGKLAAADSAKALTARNGITGRTASNWKKGVLKGHGVAVSEVEKAFAKHNGKQVKAIRVLRNLAEVTGIDIVLYKSSAGSDGFLRGETIDGVDLSDAQGAFAWKNDKLYIDINAGLENAIDFGDVAKYTMLRTFGHEFTHFCEKWNPEEYNSFRQLVFDHMERKGENVHALIEAKQEAGMSYEEASREVVAEAMTDILPETSFAQELAQKHQNLFQKLLEKLKEFLNDIKEYFNGLAGNLDPGAEALKTEIDGTMRYLEDIVKAYDRMAIQAVENYQAAKENVNDQTPTQEMSNEEAFMDSATAVQNQIRPPYSDGSKAFNIFADGLQPEARKTFDLFYGFYQRSRITNTMSVSGKRVKAVNISSLYLMAQDWNTMLANEPKWAAAAKDLAEFLPADVRKRMNMNADGTLTPSTMEKEFKMPSSLAQRLVDALPYESIDARYQLGDKTITLPEGKARQSVGGEAYRRAILTETRELYAEGKLRPVGIGTMSKDRWGSLGFLAANGKTGASGDFTTVCPQMMFNRGCWYCYRRAAMEKGVNNKLVAQNVWYTGEILRIKDSDIADLNKNGGLRIQSFGDWMPHFSAMLADVLYDAELRGLQVKIITKEPSMINYIAALREQGIGKNLYFNLSSDYTIERGPARQVQGGDSLDAVNPERPYMRDQDNSFWWKRAMSVEEASRYREKYPWVNTRIVATDVEEFIRGLKDSRVDVVTGYHGNIRGIERVDSTTGARKIEVEALGDAGMPRFAFNPVTGQWVTEYEGKTATHKRLAQAIADNGLQMEYYTKTCCITGRCASCSGKCGALARDFNVKNATNRDSESVAYWQQHMEYAVEPEFGDMTVEQDIAHSEALYPEKRTQYQARKANAVSTSAAEIEYDPTLQDWEVETALFDALDHADTRNDNLIRVGKMPNYIAKITGIDGDFYIYRNHAYENMVSEEQAIKDGRPTMRKRRKVDFHNLGFERMEQAILSLESPLVTMAVVNPEGNPTLSMVLPVTDDLGDPLYAIMSFYANRDINGSFVQKPHVLLTISNRPLLAERGSGRLSTIESIEKAIENGNILDFDKKIRANLPVIAQLTRLGNVTESALKENIARFQNDVKAFKEEKKISYQKRTSIQVDQEYMDAVNRGDMEAAQRMVNEAAKAAGYTIRAYHGTPSKGFTVFENTRIGSTTDDGIFGHGFYFSTNKITADGYATAEGGTMPVFLRIDRPWWGLGHKINEVAEELGLSQEILTARKVGKRSTVVAPLTKYSRTFTSHLIDNGYDSVVVQHSRNDYEVVVFDNTRIKSADPVTYDDNGNVIPLSERFNQEKKDIRYQKRTNSLSDREVLEYAAIRAELGNLTDGERDALRIFQQRLDKLRDLQVERERMGSLWHSQQFGGGDRNEAPKTLNRMHILDSQIERAMSEVLSIEDKKVLQRVLKKARGVIRDEEASKHRATIQRRRDSSKEAELRFKIHKTVNDLNRLLLRGDKKHHVPEGLKKAVADALEAINMADSITPEALRKAAADELARLYPQLQAAIAEKENARFPEDARLASSKILMIQNQIDAAERKKNRNDKILDRLKALRDAYDAIAKEDDPDFVYAYDVAVANAIADAVESIGDVPLSDLTLLQLEKVYDVYRMVMAAVRNANKSFIQGKNESMDQLIRKTIGEVRSAGGAHDMLPTDTDALRKFFWNNQKPVYAMEKIGSSTFMDTFWGLIDGEGKYARDVQDAFAFYDSLRKKHGYDKWNFDKKYSFESTGGTTFNLTLEQILSLYAYSKREQAHDHLRLGGFVFDSAIETHKEKDGKKSIRKYKVNVAKSHQIDLDTLTDIISTLTAEQKAFADEMQAYLSNVMGAKGNEVSMAMYDVKLFKEKNYFPLKSAKQFMFEQNETAGEVRIKNSSFTHKLTPGANNPVILSNFLDVWANHVHDMSMYHSFALPVEDFNRIFNGKTRQKEGIEPVAVKSVIQEAYGPEAVNYLKQLITDLNGGARSDPRESTAKARMGRFKKGAVFASASVVIQQPSAIIRARAMVDSRFFDINPRLTNHKKLWTEVKQYAPVAILKEMGHFDMDTGRSTVDYIKNEKSFMDKVDDKLSVAPAWADEWAWVQMWAAVKKETAAKNKGLATNSEEFLKIAGKRFTEIIVKTQVYDSTLSRSANMRSESGLMVMATAFMAEPTTSINMLEYGMRELKRGNKKTAVRYFTAVYGSMLVNSLLVSLVYAMRDDDEDETFLEKYFSSVAAELLDGIIPLTYYPWVKDAWSILQGYDVERSDMTIVADVADAFKKLFKTISTDTSNMDQDEISDHKHEVAAAWWELMEVSCTAMGMPVKNIRRDVMAVFNLVKTLSGDLENTPRSFWDEIEESLKNTLPVIGWLPGESKTDRLYEAIVNGDTAYEERILASYEKDTDTKTQNAIKAARRKALKENDPRITEAAEAYLDGDVQRYMDLIREIQDEGHWVFDEIMAAFESRKSEIEQIRGLSEESEFKPDTDNPDTLFDMDYYVDAVIAGNSSSATAIRADMLQYMDESEFESKFKNSLKGLFEDENITASTAQKLLVSHGGMDQADAKKTVSEWEFKNTYGFNWSDRADAYRDGLISAPEMKRLLMSIGGLTEEKADLQIEVYNWQNDGIDIESDQTGIVDRYRKCESYGISRTMYVDFYNFYIDSGTEGVTNSKVNECMPYINRLNLTPAQKTALALTIWSERTVNRNKLW